MSSSSTPATTASSDGPSNPPPAPASVSSAQPAPAPQPAPQQVPVAMAIPTLVSKGVHFEGLHTSNNADAGSDVPYAVAQPTPGSLPPIATARPLNNISNFNSHLGGGSNIPMVNGQPQPGMAMHQQQGPHLPYIATQMPTGADYEHSPFEFMDKCRWVAGIMLAYYVGTFLFLQPFFMGVVGMLTGFIGYSGARAPMDLVRMKWIRSYIWLNYIMVGFNLWLLAVTFLFIGSASVSSATDDDSEDNNYMYTSHGLGLLVALLVACNMLIHIRGIQTSHAFYAELLRAHMQNAPAVIIMASMASQQAVSQQSVPEPETRSKMTRSIEDAFLKLLEHAGVDDGTWEPHPKQIYVDVRLFTAPALHLVKYANATCEWLSSTLKHSLSCDWLTSDNWPIIGDFSIKKTRAMLRRSLGASATTLLPRCAPRAWTVHSAALRHWRAFASAPVSQVSRVLFFGTDDVSVATLKKLFANSQQQEGRVVDRIDVICPSDRKVGGGRGSRQDPVPVKRFALDHGLDVFHTPPQLKTLKNWEMPTLDRKYDVGVVVSFGYFLHPHMLQNLTHGAINMHPSLLPKYRGPAPIHHALLHGDTTTGVSVIEIDPRAFDVGRILLQKEFAVPEAIQSKELSQQLADFGADCVLETLRNLQQLKENAAVQDDAKACKAPKITFQDGILDLEHQSAEQIFHRWQALSDSVGVSVQFKGKNVKLIEMCRPTAEELEFATQEEAKLASSPGSFFFDKKRQAIWLKCAGDNSSWLLVTKLQQADRKVGSAVDFANGLRLKHAQREAFQ